MIKKCLICGADFMANSNGRSRSYCFECSPSNVTWGDRTLLKRQSLKKQILTKMGGSCLKCGEDRAITLDMHHIDPSIKNDSVSNHIANSQIELAFIEADKCILLCSNCHREFHELERENNILIQDYLDFEPVLNYGLHKSWLTAQENSSIFVITDKEIIQKEKEVEMKVTIEIIQKIVESGYTEIAKALNISGTALQKRVRTQGFPHRIKDLRLWYYKETNDIASYDKLYNQMNPTNTVKTKEIIEQYSLDGKLLNIFETYADAARFVSDGKDGTNISRAARGMRQTAFGFKWKTKEIQINQEG